MLVFKVVVVLKIICTGTRFGLIFPKWVLSALLYHAMQNIPEWLTVVGWQRPTSYKSFIQIIQHMHNRVLSAGVYKGTMNFCTTICVPVEGSKCTNGFTSPSCFYFFQKGFYLFVWHYILTRYWLCIYCIHYHNTINHPHTTGGKNLYTTTIPQTTPTPRGGILYYHPHWGGAGTDACI